MRRDGGFGFGGQFDGDRHQPARPLRRERRRPLPRPRASRQCPRMTLPELSIAIVLYNSGESLPDCLRSIRPELDSGFAELIAVDNASPDDSVPILEAEVPAAQVVEMGRNRGFAVGANAALARAQGRYWLLLNPDVRVPAGGLRRLVAWMDAHPALALASPDLVDVKGQWEEPGRALPSVARTLLRLFAPAPAAAVRRAPPRVPRQLLGQGRSAERGLGAGHGDDRPAGRGRAGGSDARRAVHVRRGPRMVLADAAGRVGDRSLRRAPRSSTTRARVPALTFGEDDVRAPDRGGDGCGLPADVRRSACPCAGGADGRGVRARRASAG